MDRKKQTAFFATGAAIALASSALIADFAIRKCMKKTVYTAALCVGIAGIAAGAAVAAYPKIKEVRRIRRGGTVDGKTIDRMTKSIEGVFNEDKKGKRALTPAVDLDLEDLELDDIDLDGDFSD